MITILEERAEMINTRTNIDKKLNNCPCLNHVEGKLNICEKYGMIGDNKCTREEGPCEKYTEWVGWEWI
jgi:hypothetical protein